MAPRLLTDLKRAQLVDMLKDMGQPRFRADQIWNWLYVSLAPEIDAMHNLPMALRTALKESWAADGLRPLQHAHSKDGLTWKVLFQLQDDETIESVLMHYERRNTVCVSTQVGCPIGCPFCATGQSGYRRDLSPGEIIEQVLFFGRELRSSAKRITHVVFMGMGEPLLNYENTWQAVETLNDPQGFDLGARHMTISTAGIVPAIDRMAQEPLQVSLSISLHAPDDALRSRLIPINRRYPLGELMAACYRYVARTGRRITFEYALIAGINDSPTQAESLTKLLGHLLCHVNLIPLNATGNTMLKPSSKQTVHAFQAVLQAHHIPTTIRLGRGVDIQAGCGQLRSQRAPACHETSSLWPGATGDSPATR